MVIWGPTDIHLHMHVFIVLYKTENRNAMCVINKWAERNGNVYGSLVFSFVFCCCYWNLCISFGLWHFSGLDFLLQFC